MANAPRNSDAIANAVATPKVLNNPIYHGELKEVTGLVTPAADDTANAASVHRFVRVPSNARISQVLISAADATTAGKYDIGIYQTAENGGAVVDSDLFADAFDLSGGPFSNEDVTHESGQYSVSESVQPLWQVLGLSADPSREYDVCGLVTTTFNGGPTAVALKVRYVL